MIELYDVAPGEDEAFLSAYALDAPAGQSLYRALRDDARHRFAGVDGPPRDGTLLIVVGTPDPALFAGRQGFLSAQQHGELGLVHWSSPLMYARAVAALGDPLGRAECALYARV